MLPAIRALRGSDLIEQIRVTVQHLECRRFVAEVVARLNRRIQTRLAEERSQLAALPVRRTSEYEEIEARVTKFSTVSIRRVLYSVPSRLIGHRLQFRLYPERLEGWLGGVCAGRCRRASSAANRSITGTCYPRSSANPAPLPVGRCAMTCSPAPSTGRPGSA